jgi:hypothetical protein
MSTVGKSSKFNRGTILKYTEVNKYQKEEQEAWNVLARDSKTHRQGGMGTVL